MPVSMRNISKCSLETPDRIGLGYSICGAMPITGSTAGSSDGPRRGKSLMTLLSRSEKLNIVGDNLVYIPDNDQPMKSKDKV